MTSPAPAFGQDRSGEIEIICEIESPTRPDLSRVREQVRALAAVTSAFLVPDSHIGRATVSSLVIANEVETMGGRSIACLNGRDRNLLGLRRDLLTAAVFGIDELLLVYGDDPRRGNRSDLTVEAMIDEVRNFGAETRFAAHAPFRVGAVSRLGAVPKWKHDADFLLAQVTYSLDELFTWRDALDVDIPVFAGVMVALSARTGAGIADIALPPELVAQIEADSEAGVEAAYAQIEAIAEHGGFAGVHLIPLTRYAEMAARLSPRFSRLDQGRPPSGATGEPITLPGPAAQVVR